MLSEEIAKRKQKKLDLEKENQRTSTEASESVGQLHEAAMEKANKGAQEIEKYAPKTEAAHREAMRKNLAEKHGANIEGFSKEYADIFDTKETMPSGKKERIGDLQTTHTKYKNKPITAAAFN